MCSARLAAVVVLLAAALVGCSSQPDGITQTAPVSSVIAEALEWDEWPLTVDEGSIECWDDGSVTFVTDDGDRFGLNGHARGQTDRWTDVLDIAKPGDGMDGTSLALVDLVSYATHTVCTEG